MADSLIITRGLQVPDNNFLEPIGDAWSVNGDNLIEDDCSFHFSTEGAGREIRIDVTSLGSPGDYLESNLTPYGVAAGPFVSDEDSRLTRWHFVCIARTSGMAGNVNQMLNMDLRGYTSAGDLIAGGQGSADMELLGQTDNVLLSAIGACKIHESARQYKLRLHLQDSSTGGGFVHLTMVAVGISYADTDPWLDTLSSGYQADFADQSTVRMKQLTAAGGIAPIINLPDGGAHYTQHTLNLAHLTTADKELIRRAWFWNRGSRSDDISAIGQAPLNRGTPQPVLVVLNRGTVKRAMYADFAEQVVFTQATPGWWPDSGGVWSTSLSLRERLV